MNATPTNAPHHRRIGPCLDANDVAALFGTTLTADGRATLVEHLAACDACREWVGATAAVESESDAGPVAESTTVPLVLRARRAGWVPFSIAAAALLAIGLGFARSPRAERTTGPASEAARLGAPYLDARTLAERPRGPERGGVTLLGPRGTVATPTPDVTWLDVPGMTSARVTVRDAEGALRLDVTTTHSPLSWPAGVAPLVAGATYVARVVASSPSGSVAGAEAFRVPSPDDADRFRSTIATIEASARPAWRALLCAHAAAALERWTEADAFLVRSIREGAAPLDVAPLRDLVDHHLGRPSP